MYKQFIKKIVINSCLFASFISYSILANENDFKQDILISADRQGADLKTKTSVYFDNVEIIQGSIKINADIAQVSADKKSHKTYLLKGQPAKLKKTLDDGTVVYLSANEINYQPDLFLMTVTGNALIEQSTNKVIAESIIYQLDTEQFNAQGAPSILQQTLENGDQISLEANSIIYQPSIELITIEGKAKLTQEGSEVLANKIIYNLLTEQMQASGNEEQAVTTILKPQVDNDNQSEE